VAKYEPDDNAEMTAKPPRWVTEVNAR